MSSWVPGSIKQAWAASTSLSAPPSSADDTPAEAPVMATRQFGGGGAIFQQCQRQKKELEDLGDALKEAQRMNARATDRIAALEAEVAESEAQREELRKRKDAADDEHVREAKQLREEARAAEKRARALEEEKRREEERAAAAKAAAEAAGAPQTAEEMRTTLLAAFDGAVSEVLAEAAARAGVAAPPAAGGDGDATMGDGDDDGDAADGGGGAAFRVGTAGFDSAAFVAAGLSCEEIAAQYVRAVAEQTAAVGDGARLEAVEKWMHERAKRRLLQDELQELKGSIRVLCRQRPLAAHEGESATSVPTDGEIRLVERGHARGFTFDHVFGAGAAQAEVFSEVEPVIDSVLRGFNVCILAYGQTGSGKTFTMEGKPNDDALAGINPRALCRLFEAIDERRQLERAGGAAAKADGSWSFDVAVSYLEIYNEKPNDLLAKEGAKKEELKIFASGETGVVVKNLTLVKASSAAEVLGTLQRGAARRSTSATAMNAASSRSHSLVQVHVHGRNSRTGATTTGKLNLVDLAGSERVKKSQVEGQGMKEAQGINKSLSTLGLVLNQLQTKAKSINFRDSKLTTLLQDSLGGSSKTFMIVNVSPDANSAQETKCTLEFGERARRVELGKASGNQSAGASLHELEAAQKAAAAASERAAAVEERAATITAEASEKSRALELTREQLAAAEAALDAERGRAAQSASSEAALKHAADGRAATALADERRKKETAESELQRVQAELAAAQRQLQSRAAAPLPTPTAAAPTRAPSVAPAAVAVAPALAPPLAPTLAPLAPLRASITPRSATGSPIRATPSAAAAAARAPTFSGGIFSPAPVGAAAPSASASRGAAAQPAPPTGDLLGDFGMTPAQPPAPPSALPNGAPLGAAADFSGAEFGLAPLAPATFGGGAAEGASKTADELFGSSPPPMSMTPSRSALRVGDGAPAAAAADSGRSERRRVAFDFSAQPEPAPAAAAPQQFASFAAAPANKENEVVPMERFVEKPPARSPVVTRKPRMSIGGFGGGPARRAAGGGGKGAARQSLGRRESLIRRQSIAGEEANKKRLATRDSRRGGTFATLQE